MILRELACGKQHRHHCFAAVSQAVLHPRRSLTEIYPLDQPVGLKFAKMLGQHLLRNVRDVAQEQGASLHPIGIKSEQDGQFPSPADHFQAPGDLRYRAIRSEAGPMRQNPYEIVRFSCPRDKSGQSCHGAIPVNPASK